MELRPPSEELKKARERFWEQWRTRYPPGPASSLDLSWTDLSGLSLDIDLEDCDLAYARCRGTTFGVLMLRCGAQHADFSEAFLKKAHITTSTFDDAIFRGARLIKLDAADSSFRRVDFTGADLTRCSFFRCDLRDARFTRTPLDGVGFERSLLAGANFTGCTGWIGPVRVNVGTPEDPHWIEGEDLRDWLRAAGATDVRVGYAARASE